MGGFRCTLYLRLVEQQAASVLNVEERPLRLADRAATYATTPPSPEHRAVSSSTVGPLWQT